MVAVVGRVLDLLHLPAQRHHHHGLREPLPRHFHLGLMSEIVTMNLTEVIDVMHSKMLQSSTFCYGALLRLER